MLSIESPVFNHTRLRWQQTDWLAARGSGKGKVGSAGLDLKRLSGLLERLKVDCELIDNDRAADHCVLRLSSLRRPGVVVLVEYTNLGSEPRHARMVLRPAALDLDADQGYSFDGQKTAKLEGSRAEDPAKLTRWIEKEFLR